MNGLRVRLTPLCPAGHLPLKGGDRLVMSSRPSESLRMEWRNRVLPISPLEGEMPGRAEGGKTPDAEQPQ
ncbi:lytic murein transglycosylase [Rhizobium rhizogenes]|nr:lytic murein transglycosylase [Rhizobium rhizogenes]